MGDEPLPAFGRNAATFLVEDVILTLANLRGTLDWLAAEPVAELRAAARERLDRQIDLIEDRARAHLDRIAAAGSRPSATKIWVSRGPRDRSRRLGAA